MLLRSYEDETVRRVAAGAIANLAMNGICSSISLLSFCVHQSLFLIGVIAQEFDYRLVLSSDYMDLILFPFMQSRSQSSTHNGSRGNQFIVYDSI